MLMPFSMNYRERESHARGVSLTGYLAHGNSKRKRQNPSKRIWKGGTWALYDIADMA